ncbi:MAG TPA: exodeoxyribonuclease VII small subunit [Pirellulales bacterium]
MPRDQTQPESSQPPKDFETALVRLESIVHALEDGELGLAGALGQYEEGVKLLKHCYGLLERAERRVELLCGTDAQGNPLAEPFDDQSSLELDSQGGRRSQRKSSRRTPKSPTDSEVASSGPSGPEIDEPPSLF